MTMSDTTAVTPPAQKSSGLATYFKVLFAPGDAFASLARQPTWGWAALLGIVITVLAAIIALPESTKIFTIALQTPPPNASPEQMERAQPFLHTMAGMFPFLAIFGSIIGPWINWVLVAVTYLVAAIMSKARPSFLTAWALTLNLYAIPALGAVINSVVLALRGPDSVSGPRDAVALPTLAMFAHGPPKLVAALGTIGIFSLWYWIVGALGLERTLNVSRPIAIGVMVFFALVTAVLAAWGQH